MRTVYKEIIKPQQVGEFIESEIGVPLGSRFLTAREQGGEIAVWFECNPVAPPTKVIVWAVPTGGEVPFAGNYLGTAFIEWTVWHIYVNQAI